MSKAMIGIKIADGSFYPILEEGNPGEKKLNVTTAKDDQTTVQINLYRSETGDMSDADYVDTLLIDNLVPHPKKEPSFDLIVKIDEDNVLSAEIDDPETGGKSDTKVSLVNMESKSIFDEPDYKITPEEQTETYDVAEEQSADSAESFELPDVAEEKPADNTGSFELPDLDDFALPEESVSDEEIEKALGEQTSLVESEAENSELAETPDSTDFTLPEEPVAEDVLSDDDFSFSTDLVDDENDIDEDEKPFSFDSLPDFDEIPELANSTDNSIDDDLDIDFAVPETNNTSENSDMYADYSEKQPEYEYAASNNMQSALFGDSDLFEETKKQKERKVLVPVIICILCALISLGVLGVILYLTPSIVKLAGGMKDDETAIEKTMTAAEESSNIAAEEAIVIEQPVVRHAETNEIVVLKDTVSPVVPENKETKKEVSSIIRHLVKWGDTLWDLAGFYYRNPWLYRIISDANDIKNPDLIISGTYLTIPDR